MKLGIKLRREPRCGTEVVEGVGRTVLHIVSYSYPPENVPAAHRPYQLALALEKKKIPFAIYTKRGVIRTSHAGTDGISMGSGGGGGARPARRFRALRMAASRLITVDKGLLWGIRTLPKLCMAILRDRRDAGEPPIVWATCPLMTNVYLAGVASWATRVPLYVDIRDAIDGLRPEGGPLLTKLVLKRAKGVSVVSPSLATLAARLGISTEPLVAYNGVSRTAVQAAASKRSLDVENRDWVDVAYTGAVYGGDRPYIKMIEALSLIARESGDGEPGIRLSIATREDLGRTLARYEHGKFKVVAVGEVSKTAALELSARSDVNVVLVGRGPAHRLSIPLKVYDLLGVGRPILYFGPPDSDSSAFLRKFANNVSFLVDSEGPAPPELRSWLWQARTMSGAPITEPDALAECDKLVRLMHLAPVAVDSGRDPSSGFDTRDLR